MDYAKAFARALQALKDEGRYRVFADIRRDRGPLRTWIGCGGAVDVVDELDLSFEGHAEAAE